MRTSRPARLLASAVSAAALVGAMVVAPPALAQPTPATHSGPVAKPGPADRDAAAEARKVDRVRTPEPDWWDCSSGFGIGECTTVELPLDYDEPRGPTTTVALLRVRATDPENRIGTLFLNPGGPGGSGVEMAAVAPFFLSPEVLERFDVVGVDPRGTNYSTNVRCFRNFGEQAQALAGYGQAVPVGEEEERAFIATAKAIGTGCSTTGLPLAAAMSTAQVARDHDVLRRMVGDDAFTYLGFSYGSYLGTVYASMFPDRVRAVAIDGVVDPEAWRGDRDRGTPVFNRLGSDTAAWRAFAEVLDRCAAAGPEYCSTAGLGDPHAVFAEVVDGVRTAPVDVVLPSGEVVTVDYAVLVRVLLQLLYYPQAGTLVDTVLSLVHLILQPADEGSELAAAQEAARAQLGQLLWALFGVGAGQGGDAVVGGPGRAGGNGVSSGDNFPYSNALEGQAAVMCTDGRHPARAEDWRRHAARSHEVAPHFGRAWTWISAPCAERTWRADDEDAYRGPFTRPTSAPLLVVGNTWDPATRYEGAVAAAELLPASRLLVSENWGHTAYGTSACATSAIDAYLLEQTLPDEGLECVGDVQPFTEPLEPGEPGISEEPSMSLRSLPPESSGAPGVPDRLPPVVPPFPGSVPRT